MNSRQFLFSAIIVFIIVLFAPIEEDMRDTREIIYLSQPITIMMSR